MRLNKIQKIAFSCLLAVVLLGSGGIVYAAQAHTLDVTGTAEACTTVPTPPGTTPALVVGVVSNDNGIIENLGGYTPIDVGDNGLDPAGSLVPYQSPPAQTAGTACTRYDKNVAYTTAAISNGGHLITATVNNAYPYYHPTVFFQVANDNPTLATVDSVIVTNPNPEALTAVVNGISPGQTIPVGSVVLCSLDMQLEQVALQNHTYTVTVQIIMSGEDSTGGGCGDGDVGTPGFWRNNWDHFYRQSDMIQWLKNIDAASQWISDPTSYNPWTVNDMYAILDAGVSRNANDRTRFLRHYLATWLNIESGRLSLSRGFYIGDINGYKALGIGKNGTVEQIMDAIESKYSGSGVSSSLYQTMKNICDKINNSDI